MAGDPTKATVAVAADVTSYQNQATQDVNFCITCYYNVNHPPYPIDETMSGTVDRFPLQKLKEGVC